MGNTAKTNEDLMEELRDQGCNDFSTWEYMLHDQFSHAETLDGIEIAIKYCREHEYEYELRRTHVLVRSALHAAGWDVN